MEHAARPPFSHLLPPTVPSNASRSSRASHAHRTVSTETIPFLPDPSTLLNTDGYADPESFAPRGEEDLYVRVEAHEQERRSLARQSRLRSGIASPSGESQHGPSEQIPLAPSSDTDSSVSDDDEDDEQLWASRKWYQKPSPWWLIPTLLMSASLGAMTMAPKVEMYNRLVCREHRPEYSSHGPIRTPGAPEESKVTLPPGPQIPGSGHAEAGEAEHVERFMRRLVKWAPDLPQNRQGGAPPPSALCRADPLVQREVAKMNTAMMTTMGILSVLTTGAWASRSDRWGRTRILAVSIIGVLITDANFLLVAHASEWLPGGYRFLIVGPLIDGLMGGMPTASAAAHAYIGDSTAPAARSRMFSLYAGLAFTGMALGPTLGALLINATGDLLSVFYAATTGHVLYAFAIIFFIPESLSPSARRRIARRGEDRKRAWIDREEEESRLRIGGRSVVLTVWKTVRPLFGFLSPLAIFAPRPREMGENGYSSGKKDWNLTRLAVGYASVLLMTGMYSFKFQYAQSQFGWDAQRLGYWFSIVGVFRAFHLIVLLPLLLKLLRPRVKPQQAIALPVTPSEPLERSRSPSPSASKLTGSSNAADSQRKAIAAAASQAADAHSPRFDLIVARSSLTIELLCEIGQAIAPGPNAWTAATLLGSFGGGFTPAMQSLSLGLLRLTDETGRLFGALSVMSALCSQIIGPAIFGLTYAATVGTFPRAIFCVACFCAATGLTYLFTIRVPKPMPVQVPTIVLQPSPTTSSSSAPAAEESASPRPAMQRDPSRGRRMSRGNVRDVAV